MSRIGNNPITIPSGVTVTVKQRKVTIVGPKGQLELVLPTSIKAVSSGQQIVIERSREDKKTKALHGLVRALIANHVHGVTEGWTKTLELSGVGYRANLEGAVLVLNLGFSHPVKVTPPQGITFSVVEGKIIVSGIDKSLVGLVTAKIRAIKKPEPYKGKGIKYAGEHIRRKAGKAAKAIGGAVAGGVKK